MNYKPGDEVKYLNMTDHPLEIALIALPKPMGQPPIQASPEPEAP